MVKEGIKKFREVALLEKINYARLEDKPDCIEDCSFTKDIKHMLVKNIVVAPLCVVGLYVEEAIMKQGSLKAVTMIKP